MKISTPKNIVAPNAFIVTAMLLVLSQPVAEAGIAVSPTRVVLHGKPSQALVTFFRVENQGDAPINVKVEPEDWTSGLSGARKPASWLVANPQKVTLKAGKHARVKCVIRVPKQASGELRTQVFFTTEGNTVASMPMRSRLGTIIYVGIKGTEKFDATISDVQLNYTAEMPQSKRPDSLDVVIGVRNRGNTHIVPEGSVMIRDAEGNVIETIPIPAGWGLIPNEEDKYHAIAHGLNLKASRYTLEVTVLFGEDLGHKSTTNKIVHAVLTEEGKFQVTPQ